MKAARRARVVATAVAVAGLAAAVSGCITRAESGNEIDTTETVGGVGELPGTATSDPPVDPPDSVFVESPVTPPTTAPLTSLAPVGTIGEQAGGNRVLLIGDSITASISHRYGNQACKRLVPLGWQVEVEAEPSRAVVFGKKVLKARLDAGWDSAVVFLGNNYDGDETKFQNELNALLVQLYPRPTLVINTTVFRDEQREVNDAINQLQKNFDNMVVLDWATITADEPALTGADSLHLTEPGRERLGYEIANVFGPAPEGSGKCLDSVFTDDSSGSANGPPGNETGTKTTTKPPNRPSSSTTTVNPTQSSFPGVTTTAQSTNTSAATNTTAKPPSTTNTTTPPSSSTATTAPSSSTPPPDPPTTAPPP